MSASSGDHLFWGDNLAPLPENNIRTDKIKDARKQIAAEGNGDLFGTLEKMPGASQGITLARFHLDPHPMNTGGRLSGTSKTITLSFVAGDDYPALVVTRQAKHKLGSVKRTETIYKGQSLQEAFRGLCKAFSLEATAGFFSPENPYLDSLSLGSLRAAICNIAYGKS